MSIYCSFKYDILKNIMHCAACDSLHATLFHHAIQESEAKEDNCQDLESGFYGSRARMRARICRRFYKLANFLPSFLTYHTL